MFQIDARPGGLPRYTLAEEVECLMFISDEARKCAVFVGYKKSNGEYAFAGTAFFVSHIVTEQGSSFLGDEGYGFSYLVPCQISRLINIPARRTLPVWQEQRNPSNYQLTNEAL